MINYDRTREGAVFLYFDTETNTKQQNSATKPHNFIKNLLTSNTNSYIMIMYQCKSITIYI